MKHVLLGTTALVAAGFVVGQAQAADPIKLTLGGFYGAAAGAEIGGNNADGSPSDNRQHGAFKNNVEIYFNGSTTLDNGLTAGVHVELEGNNAGTNVAGHAGGDSDKGGDVKVIDEVFMYFKGGFGEFRFGDTGGALGKSCVSDPGLITNNFGLISPNNSFTNVGRNAAMGLGGMGTCEDHGNGTKAVYFSPVFGGFQGVISFAPNSAKSAGPTTGTGSTKDDRNILEGSINFNKSFGAVSVTGNVAGEYTFSGGGNGPNPWEAQAGLVLGWGRWQVGASGEFDGNYGGWLASTSTSVPVANSDDAYFITAGAAYAIDAWTVGLEGIYGNLETTQGHDQYKAVSLQGTYKLGPGIRLEGEVAYFWYNQNHNGGFTGSNATSQSASVGIGSYMTF